MRSCYYDYITLLTNYQGQSKISSTKRWLREHRFPNEFLNEITPEIMQISGACCVSVKRSLFGNLRIRFRYFGLFPVSEQIQFPKQEINKILREETIVVIEIIQNIYSSSSVSYCGIPPNSAYNHPQFPDYCAAQTSRHSKQYTFMFLTRILLI